MGKKERKGAEERFRAVVDKYAGGDLPDFGPIFGSLANPSLNQGRHEDAGDPLEEDIRALPDESKEEILDATVKARRRRFDS